VRRFEMMTEAITRSPEESPAPAQKGGRHRLLTAVVAVVLLAAAVGAVLVHRSVARELLTATEGNAIGAFPGDDVDDTFAERDVVKATYQEGEAYTFEFTINNPTRWSARVLDFPVTPDFGMLQPVSISIDTTPFDGPDRTFTPFRPLTIDAGEAAMVRVHTRFADCERFDPGHSSTLAAIPVRYRALWATQTTDIELPTFIRVDAPDNC
jgi:hypothetical protein